MPPVRENTPHRWWLVTCNSPHFVEAGELSLLTEGHKTWHADFFEAMCGLPNIKYVCAAAEIAPTTHRLHGHAFVEFESPKRHHWVVQRAFAATGEQCDIRHNDTGSKAAALAYTKKDGVFKEFGSATRQGQRTDLEAAAELVRTGGAQAVAENMGSTYIRYARGLHQLEDALRDDDELRDIQVCCLWGPTNTGKTHRAYHWARAHRSELGGMWIGRRCTATWYAYGYKGERIIIIDEMTGSFMPLGLLLGLLDKYPMMVNISGRGVPWRATRVIMTSNQHPSTWYPNGLEVHREALMRRFHTIAHVTSRDQDVSLWSGRKDPLVIGPTAPGFTRSSSEVTSHVEHLEIVD